jgi:hypothetical protein
MEFVAFLQKCAKKLALTKEQGELKRCFDIKTGAEVDDPEDLMPGTKLDRATARPEHAAHRITHTTN